MRRLIILAEVALGLLFASKGDKTKCDKLSYSA